MRERRSHFDAAAVPPLSQEPSGEVVLVDENDHPIGVAPKLAAHENGGQLHRAFSVFIVNSRGEMLLQQRAATKYHFGGLWTNACCSHPGPGEDVAGSARARLAFEFGIDVPLRKLFDFVYRANDPGSGLTEHEFDHVFLGVFDGTPRPNPDEIAAYEWMPPAALMSDLLARPGRYTPWFRIALERVLTTVTKDSP